MGATKARVLVTGAEYTGGLAALRALRAGGFEPWSAVTTAEAYGRVSASVGGVVEIPELGSDPVSWCRSLADVAARVGAAVVMPGTDRALLAVAGNAEMFEPDIRVGAPAAELVQAALGKDRVNELAVDIGLEVPQTGLVRLDREDSGISAPEPPALVKPIKSELEVEGSIRRFQARFVRDRPEMMSAIATLPDRSALVQRYVEGPLYTVNGVAWRGEVEISVHKRATRTWPLDSGPVCRAVTVPLDPQLDLRVRELLRRLEWSGLFNIQLIEGSTSRYLIDFNPRLYHSLGLAVAAGANLPSHYASLLLGRSPVAPSYRSGVHFRSADDLRATRELVRRRAYRRAAADPLPLGPVVCPVLSVRDPRPFLAASRRWLQRHLGRLAQRVSKRCSSTRSAA